MYNFPEIRKICLFSCIAIYNLSTAALKMQDIKTHNVSRLEMTDMH